ncbi:MAG: DUF2127 domain-containing protein [Acidovorax sp.]
MNSTRHALRTIAAFEAFKGLLVLAVASGVLALARHDLHQLAIHLVAHLHLNPAAKYPSIFIAAAQHLQDTRLTLLALGAAAYALLRFVEAYGLLRGAAWAEVLAAVSGGIYLPFEAAELVRHPGWLSVGTLLVNVVVVAVAVFALWERRRRA